MSVLPTCHHRKRYPLLVISYRKDANIINYLFKSCFIIFLMLFFIMLTLTSPIQDLHSVCVSLCAIILSAFGAFSNLISLVQILYQCHSVIVIHFCHNRENKCRQVLLHQTSRTINCHSYLLLFLTMHLLAATLEILWFNQTPHTHRYGIQYIQH